MLTGPVGRCRHHSNSVDRKTNGERVLLEKRSGSGRRIGRSGTGHLIECKLVHQSLERVGVIDVIPRDRALRGRVQGRAAACVRPPARCSNQSRGTLRLSRYTAAQLGTVGSGNHYVDLRVHFGSRGLGHTSASKYLKLAGGRDGMNVPPRPGRRRH